MEMGTGFVIVFVVHVCTSDLATVEDNGMLLEHSYVTLYLVLFTLIYCF